MGTVERAHVYQAWAVCPEAPRFAGQGRGGGRFPPTPQCQHSDRARTFTPVPPFNQGQQTFSGKGPDTISSFTSQVLKP